MDKKISVRIPSDLYDKIRTHEQKNSDIVRKALYQFFRDKEPNYNVEQFVIKSYDKQIEYLKEQIEDWKKVSIMNSSIWQILKMKLLQEKQPQLESRIVE